MVRVAPYVAAAGSAVLVGLVLSGRFAQFDPTVVVWGYATVDLVCAAAIVTAASPVTTHLGAALDNRVLRTLGKYSYAMYVFHLFVISLLAKAFPMRRLFGSADLGFLAWSAGAVVGTLAVALLSWSLFERPILSLKRFFSYGPRPSSPSGEERAPAPVRAAPLTSGGTLEGD
jgi:peptidoglycan/LPS O-acetylase OafA/YrhL